MFYVETYQEHFTVRPVPQFKKAAPINATADGVHLVTQGFYLLYKPENNTGTVHQVHTGNMGVAHFSHRVHGNVGLYRKYKWCLLHHPV